MSKRLLKGARVVDPASGRDGMFDVLIDGGRIARVGDNLAAEVGTTFVEIPRPRNNPSMLKVTSTLLIPSADAAFAPSPSPDVIFGKCEARSFSKASVSATTANFEAA